jgi:putative zinc finger/helix-turn-helix YgiT family protein
MHPKQAEKTKRAPKAERPFPWRCRHCGKQEVVMATTQYNAEVRHDGRLHIFTIPRLELPVCQACGQKVFTEQVDAQVNNALRAHLKLLTPDQIRDGIKRVRLSQKNFAARLGIAAATLSRWLNETQIQSRAMDNLVRAFLAFPQLRTALSGESQDPRLGISDAMSSERSGGHSDRTKQRGNAAVDASRADV